MPSKSDDISIFTWEGCRIVNAKHKLNGFLSVVKVHLHSFSLHTWSEQGFYTVTFKGVPKCLCKVAYYVLI